MIVKERNMCHKYVLKKHIVPETYDRARKEHVPQIPLEKKMVPEKSTEKEQARCQEMYQVPGNTMSSPIQPHPVPKHVRRRQFMPVTDAV